MSISIEGYIAYTGGTPVGGNPYPPNSMEYEEWRQGWYSAHHQDLIESRDALDDFTDDYIKGYGANE